MARKRSSPQPARGTSLEQRMNESGGIRPGAHPEFEQPTPLDQAAAAARAAARAVQKAIRDAQKALNPSKPRRRR
jgi:hypothetical protein